MVVVVIVVVAVVVFVVAPVISALLPFLSNRVVSRFVAAAGRADRFICDLSRHSAMSSYSTPTKSSSSKRLKVTMATPPTLPNPVAQADQRDKVDMLKEMAEEALNDLSYVDTLYAAFRRRRKEKTEQASWELDAEYATVRSMRQLPDVDIAVFLASRSDLSVEEVAAACASCGDARVEGLAFETQLPLNIKFPEEMKSKDITWKVLRQLADANHGRMKEFKKNNGLNNQKFVFGPSGCYKCVFNGDGKLTKIQRPATGAVAEVPSQYPFVKGKVCLVHNYSDEHATLETQGFPPIKLAALFNKAAKEGPHAITKVTTLKGLQKIAVDITAATLAARTVGAGSKDQHDQMHADAVKALGSLQETEKGKSAARARNAAAKMLAKKTGAEEGVHVKLESRWL